MLAAVYARIGTDKLGVPDLIQRPYGGRFPYTDRASEASRTMARALCGRDERLRLSAEM